MLNVCINEIMSEWNKKNKKRVKITRNKDIKPIFFADDQVVVAEWENLLQRSGY